MKNYGSRHAGAACTVVNIHREPCDVYIGRRTFEDDGYFGNPFMTDDDGSRERALEKFADYFQKRVKTDAEYRYRLSELQGKRLGCYCKPARCHGDIIAAYVNSM